MMVWKLALPLLFCVSVSAEPMRVLCIGDSITQGGRKDRAELTYRLPLQQMLKALRPVDFIGTQRAGLDGFPWPVTFDPDHESYYGETTEQVRERLGALLARVR